jgi:GntR family transcriptional regulator, transcriptional repressor for pyruvate dehydrogenase complex
MPTTDADLLQGLVERTVFTPVRHGSAVAETVARLGRAIGMGLLRPGDRLPPEGRLAEALGISPVTLRNALTILRGGGLLETQRGRSGGTFVTHSAAAPLLDGSLPTEAELRDLVDFRVVVEGGAAALAAARGTAEQLGYLERLVCQMAETREYEPWSERDALFHLIVANASGSQRVVAQVAEARAEVYRIATLGSVPRAAVELADREHREILRALVARRPARARAAMVRHVESTGALWLGLRTERSGGEGR